MFISVTYRRMYTVRRSTPPHCLVARCSFSSHLTSQSPNSLRRHNTTAVIKILSEIFFPTLTFTLTRPLFLVVPLPLHLPFTLTLSLKWGKPLL